uniref:Uncharacterized protein n=1 Tax=Arundo donax TaxID=35708 RepID=A0A0A8Z0Q1_ARUDO
MPPARSIRPLSFSLVSK